MSPTPAPMISSLDNDILALPDFPSSVFLVDNHPLCQLGSGAAFVCVGGGFIPPLTCPAKPVAPATAALSTSPMRR